MFKRSTFVPRLAPKSLFPPFLSFANVFKKLLLTIDVEAGGRMPDIPLSRSVGRSWLSIIWISSCTSSCELVPNIHSCSSNRCLAALGLNSTTCSLSESLWESAFLRFRVGFFGVKYSSSEGLGGSSAMRYWAVAWPVIVFGFFLGCFGFGELSFSLLLAEAF